MSIAESLTCAYKWNRYDLLCLPPSFPYGGVLFVSDHTDGKSLLDVCDTNFDSWRPFFGGCCCPRNFSQVNVDLNKSWTGNLITNHTWEHFWLNEGYTMWLERKIISKISKDPKMIDFDAELGWKHLEGDVELFGKDN